MKRSYKVGDKVRIKENLVDDYNASYLMLLYSGCLAEITKVVGDFVYKINIDGEYWNWTADMFVSI